MKSHLFRFSMPVAGLVLGTMVFAMTVFGSAGGALASSTVIRQCQISTGPAARLSVTYTRQVKSGKVSKHFDASLEVSRADYKEGKWVKFLVRGVKVGSRKLIKDENGDLEADLQLTTKRSSGRKAWPDNFPNVKPGTTVKAKIGKTVVLSCTLS